MNLGALCRTAEVWHLQSLVVANQTVLKSRELRRVAVSAEQWQPIDICPLPRLPEWIRQQQRQQVQVIALTRHPTAIALPHFGFAPRAAILLGRELTGIPPTLMQQCNATVEIPQWGQVESLNVGTAGAIAAYEYLRQHAV